MQHPLNLTLDLYLQRMEQSGAFDGLSGSGEPIDNLDGPAPDVLARLMTEAQARPLVVELHRKQAALREQLATVRDADERRALLKQIADTQTWMAVELEALNK